jgi:uncharacterized protein YndB with AHSA1/START domain
MDTDTNTTQDLGSYIEHEGRPAVRFERTYAHPIERVWAAISEPAELRHWFPAHVAIEARVGGGVEFSGDPYAETYQGVVLAFDPPRRLAFTWGDDELHLDLAETEDGRCRLVLIDVLDGKPSAARNAAGWSVCLGELDKALSGRPGDGPHSDSTAPFQPLYDAYVAAGMPSGAPFPDQRSS